MAIDTIKSSAVLDGAIATADIADDAVTSAKLDTNIAIDGKLGIGDSTVLGNKVHIRTGGSATSVNASAGLVLEDDDSTRCDLQFMGPDGAFHSILFGDVSDDDIGKISYSHSGNNMRFNVNTAERMRLTADGLTFNGDTAAANALDDYEEGTWTPTLVDASNNAAAVNSGSTGGTYTKIGRMVAITGRCTTTSVSGLSSIVYVKNLPFTSLSGQAGYATLAVGQAFNLNISAGQSVELSISPNDTKAQVRLNDHGSGNTHMSPSEWSDDGYVMFSGVYVTA